MKLMQNDDASWEQIYHDIDTILNGGESENHEAGRRKPRIIRLNWNPNKSTDKSESYSAQGGMPPKPILIASARDRRHLF